MPSELELIPIVAVAIAGIAVLIVWLPRSEAPGDSARTRSVEPSEPADGSRPVQPSTPLRSVTADCPTDGRADSSIERSRFQATLVSAHSGTEDDDPPWEPWTCAWCDEQPFESWRDHLSICEGLADSGLAGLGGRVGTALEGAPTSTWEPVSLGPQDAGDGWLYDRYHGFTRRDDI